MYAHVTEREEQPERMYTETEVQNLMQQFTWEAVEKDVDPRHIFDDTGICIRCSADAEEWESDCVEGLLFKWEAKVNELTQRLQIARFDIEDLKDQNKHLINMAKGR